MDLEKMAEEPRVGDKVTVECEECYGQGYVLASDGNRRVECPECGGSGELTVEYVHVN